MPGQHQTSLASAKEFDPSKLGLDLDAHQVGLLDGYVRDLPRPATKPTDPIAPFRGRVVFESIGCATCHAQRLGNVDGLFSDLLLHDLGDRLLDVSGGGYGGGPTRVQLVERRPRPSAPRRSGARPLRAGSPSTAGRTLDEADPPARSSPRARPGQRYAISPPSERSTQTESIRGRIQRDLLNGDDAGPRKRPARPGLSSMPRGRRGRAVIETREDEAIGKVGRRQVPNSGRRADSCDWSRWMIDECICETRDSLRSSVAPISFIVNSS